MRLLVYGGNQHGERRRIGIWPDAIGPQVFQDTYGSSMMSASYGVGVLDASPFVILRKIENFGQRAYPLAVLFDPGGDNWERFRWNGAHLLWALFGGVDSPGIRLIVEPESYHSEQHLALLLEEIDENALPQPDADLVNEEATPLLTLWSGAVFSDAPLVVPPDPRLMGFNARPDLQSLSFLLGKLPLPLRCGRGWLFGGRISHGSSLGAFLVFDDSKSEPPAGVETQTLFGFQERGAKLRAAFDTLSSSDVVDRARALNEYLVKPVHVWKGEKREIIPEVLDDLILLNDLVERGAGEQVVRRVEIDELFGTVNRRLSDSGSLNPQIVAAAYRLIAATDKELTGEETAFILKHCTDDKSQQSRDKLRNRLDEEAAFTHFVGQRIYPSDAAGWMPAEVRVRVCEKLLAAETQDANIPDIFTKEMALSPKYDDNELRTLLAAAVKRSADFTGGLRAWGKLFTNKQIGANAREAVQTEALRRVHAENPDSLADYLLLSDDSGGERLSESKPAFRRGEMLERLVAFIVEKFKEKEDDELSKKAQAWLRKLAASDLRLNVGLGMKDEIASLLKKGWESYAVLRKAFKGEIKPSATLPETDEGERHLLSQELTVMAGEELDPRTRFIPALDTMTALLSPDRLGSVVASLINLEPVMDNAEPERWVKAWLRLSELKLEANQRLSCRTKHQMEYIRLLLHTEAPLGDGKDLRSLNEAQLKHLFKELLGGGGVEVDKRRRDRFIEVSQSRTAPHEVTAAFQQAYREISAHEERKDAFARRFVGNKVARELIAHRLNEKEKHAFDVLVKSKARAERTAAEQELVAVLTSGAGASSPYEAILDVKNRAAATEMFGFSEVLTAAFERVLENDELKNDYLSGDASAGECLKLYHKANLSQSLNQRLTELAAQKKQHERHRALEDCIFKGSPSQDKEYRQILSDLLRGRSEADHDREFDDLVRRALATPDGHQTLFRRFISVTVSPHEGQRRKYLTDTDPLMNSILKNLQDTTRIDFLNKLWETNNSKQDWENPVNLTAREVFTKWMEYTDNSGKTKRKKKTKTNPKKLTLNHVEESILMLLGSNEKLRKRIGRLEFGRGEEGRIDEYLSDYLVHDARADKTSKDEPETGVLTKPRGGLKRFFTGLFNDSNKNDAGQEDED